MLKNITFSADQHLLHQARKKAQAERTTLNARFRQWLEQYAFSGSGDEYQRLMDELSYAKPVRRHSRDELNER